MQHHRWAVCAGLHWSARGPLRAGPLDARACLLRRLAAGRRGALKLVPRGATRRGGGVGAQGPCSPRHPRPHPDGLSRCRRRAAGPRMGRWVAAAPPLHGVAPGGCCAAPRGVRGPMPRGRRRACAGTRVPGTRVPCGATAPARARHDARVTSRLLGHFHCIPTRRCTHRRQAAATESRPCAQRRPCFAANSVPALSAVQCQCFGAAAVHFRLHRAEVAGSRHLGHRRSRL